MIHDFISRWFMRLQWKPSAISNVRLGAMCCGRRENLTSFANPMADPLWDTLDYTADQRVRKLVQAPNRCPSTCKVNFLHVLSINPDIGGAYVHPHATLTTIFPKFRPSSTSFNAFGAASSPSTNCSLYWMEPSASHRDISLEKLSYVSSEKLS